VLGSEEAANVLRPAWWSPFRTASLVRAAGESAFAAAQAPLEVVPADQLLGDPRLAVVPVRVAVLHQPLTGSPVSKASVPLAPGHPLGVRTSTSCGRRPARARGA
jgi:hypothetical protein